MKQGFILAVAVAASFACFTSEATAQRFGRRNVQYSNNTQHVHQHTHQHVHSTPANVIAHAAPVTSGQTIMHTTYHPNTAQAVQTASGHANSGSGTAQMMLQRNNEIRASRGMGGMHLSERLTAAAQNHASYMARTGQFSHNVNGDPQSRAAMFGFGGGVRENIAMGQNSVSSAFQDWTNSSGHYTNMMSQSNAAGFGYAVNSSGQGFWVAMYGNE